MQRTALTTLLGTLLSAVTVAGQIPQWPPVGDASRTLYVKLPLTQPQFHWRFADRDAFLAGRLSLRIFHDGGSSRIVVFDGGVITPGWEPLGEDVADQIYFGFQSTTAYPTGPADSLEIELRVLQDLDGTGPSLSGILPAGTYTAKGSYSLLMAPTSDHWLANVALMERIPVEELKAMPEAQALVARLAESSGPPALRAFMECWQPTWDLRPTGSGWLTAEQVAENERREVQRTAQMDEARAMVERLGGDASVMAGLRADGPACH